MFHIDATPAADVADNDAQPFLAALKEGRIAGAFRQARGVSQDMVAAELAAQFDIDL